METPQEKQKSIERWKGLAQIFDIGHKTTFWDFSMMGFSCLFGPIFSYHVPIPTPWNDNSGSMSFCIISMKFDFLFYWGLQLRIFLILEEIFGLCIIWQLCSYFFQKFHRFPLWKCWLSYTPAVNNSSW